MSLEPVEIYAYFRVAAESMDAALADLREFQARLCEEWPQTEARLLRRDDTNITDGLVTLMEIYRWQLRDRAPAADWLACALAGLSQPGWLQGQRHVERFVPCV